MPYSSSSTSGRIGSSSRLVSSPLRLSSAKTSIVSVDRFVAAATTRSRSPNASPDRMSTLLTRPMAISDSVRPSRPCTASFPVLFVIAILVSPGSPASLQIAGSSAASQGFVTGSVSAVACTSTTSAGCGFTSSLAKTASAVQFTTFVAVSQPPAATAMPTRSRIRCTRM